MCWDRVIEKFSTDIFPLMSAPDRGKSWGDILKASADGTRLGLCLGIDIESGALEPGFVALMLEGVDLSVSDGRLAFSERISGSDGEDFVCVSRHAAGALDSTETYVRIIDLWEFLDYYVCPTYGYSLNPTNAAEVRRDFLGTLANQSLGDISEWWTGGTGRVWVGLWSELQSIIAMAGPNEGGTSLNDALGLAKDPQLSPMKTVELLAVRYPTAFTVKCTQPTALDAAWRRPGGYYLSSGKGDGWGRTHSCSGGMTNCRERVHRGFKGLSDAFNLSEIGSVSHLVSNPTSLQMDGCNRFNEAVTSNSKRSTGT